MVAKYKFRATDAFTYVDTYRRAILATADRIEEDKTRLEDQVWTTKNAPLRDYAQLRALEHAQDFVVSRKEPGVVILGESGDDAEAESLAAAAAQVPELKQALDKRAAEVETLQASLQQAKQKLADFEAQLVAREQQGRRLQHRLSTSQSTITVLSATSVVLTMALVFLLLS